MKFKVNDKVMMNVDFGVREFYPVRGTIGTIVAIDYGNCQVQVQWSNGSTSGDDLWWINMDKIVLVEKRPEDYTNDEIWDFLRPKMKQHYENCDNLDYSIKQMAVSAYRSAWGRCEKGRSFAISKRDVKSTKDRLTDMLRGMEIVSIYTNGDETKISNLTLNKVTVVNQLFDYDKDYRVYSRVMEIRNNDDGIFRVDREGWDWLSNDVMYVPVPLEEVNLQEGDKIITMDNLIDHGERTFIKKFTVCKFKYDAGGSYGFTDEDGVGWGIGWKKNLNNMRVLVPLKKWLKDKGVKF